MKKKIKKYKCPYCKHNNTNETGITGDWYCNDCGYIWTVNRK
jgi:ribosomal protein L37AE/L43A